MSIRVFLDTNIIFDVIDTGRPNSTHVKTLFSIFKHNNISLCISAITINNIIYVLQNRFKIDADILKKKVSRILELFEVVPYDFEVLVDGLKLPFNDIEASFQFISALKCKADYLITEDKDFLKHNCNDLKLKIINTYDIVKVLSERFGRK